MELEGVSGRFAALSLGSRNEARQLAAARQQQADRDQDRRGHRERDIERDEAVADGRLGQVQPGNEWRARIYALKYVLSLGVSSVAVPLIAWLHLADAPAGNGFVALYIALAVAAAVVAAVSLLLPGRRELAAQPVQAAGS